MTGKHLLLRNEARDKVLKGATALADAMRITLGPRSRSVLIGKPWGAPLVCNDGMTIAREMELTDPDEDLGARVLRDVAIKTGEAVGDGTTTATLIAHAVFEQGLRNVVAGASAVALKRGLDCGLLAATAAIRAQSRPVSTPAEKLQVATIAAHNDPSIGRTVADAFERVGAEGVITVEDARGTETTLEVVDGMRFDQGYLSSYFVTDAEKMECVLEEPLVLLHERRIGAARDLLPLLEKAAQAGRALLLIAEDVDGEALALLALNRLRGTLQVAAVKAPGFGDRRREMLRDMAALTGGQVVSEDLGNKLEQMELADLGSARRVVVTRDTTTLVGGHGSAESIRARATEIRSQVQSATSEYDKEKLEERLARLQGGVAVIRVGAHAESELKARREAFDDAISATRAALAEGIVPGAGLALLRAARALAELETRSEGDEKTGIHLLRLALEAPTRQIACNSDLDPGVVVQRMSESNGTTGLDASSGAWVDLYEAGIVDATRAVRIGLENAVSIAGLLLLTDATLTEVPGKSPTGAEAHVE